MCISVLETEVTRTFSSRVRLCLKLLQRFQYLREYTELLREEVFTLHNRMEKIKTSFSQHVVETVNKISVVQGS